MARPKGAPKVGGRVKGTPNKIKLEIRMKMSDFIIDHFNDIYQCAKVCIASYSSRTLK